MSPLFKSDSIARITEVNIDLDDLMLEAPAPSPPALFAGGRISVAARAAVAGIGWETDPHHQHEVNVSTHLT
jgi:hypothetical protein